MSSTKPYGFKKITLHYTRYFSLWCATSGLGAPISAYVGNQTSPNIQNSLFLRMFKLIWYLTSGITLT